MVYRKRYNRRYKNKTKKFNRYAYAKTDSKNQAKQIVRLNKKISNVYRTLKPEIIKKNNNGQVAAGAESINTVPFETLINSDLASVFKGNYAKFIYFNFRVFFNPTSTDLTQGKSFRIVILQNKYPIAAAPTATEIFNNPSNTYGVFSPFKDDIHLKYKILLSKVIFISSDKDFFYRSFNFKKLINYKKTSGNELKYQRGCIFVSVYAPYAQSELAFNWTSKFGYVDTLN